MEVESSSYQISVREKLQKGHNAEKVDLEEQELVYLFQKMTPDEIQDLETTIWLVADYVDENTDYKIPVPKKIRLMCKTIDDWLKQDESQKEFRLEFNHACLQIIVDYCRGFEYLKIRSTLDYPLRINCMFKHMNEIETSIMLPIRNDLFSLQHLLGCCKVLQCEALYQTTAATIAFWFKVRSISEALDQSQLNPNIQQEPKQKFRDMNELKIKFPYLFDDSKRKDFEL